MIHITITQAPLFEKGYPYTIQIEHNIPISDIVEKADLNKNIPFICQVNGNAILRQQWSHYIPHKKDVVTFTYYPLQGGGGQGTSRAVAMLGVMAAAAAMPGILGVTGNIGSSLITGTTTALGALAVNAILPPTIPSSGDFIGQQQLSPTYSINAQGNKARIGNPIPVQYGTHKIYPDFAATPYHTYVDNEQYLHILFCIGLGYFNTDDAKLYIDDTPLENYTDISFEWVGPDDQLTQYQFKTQIAEIGTFELKAPNQAQNINNDDGSVTTDERWLGWYIANAAATQIDKIDVDFLLSQGLNGVVEWEIYAQEIDDNGNTINDIIHDLSSSTLINVTKTYTEITQRSGATYTIDVRCSSEWVDSAAKTLIETTRVLQGQDSFDNNNFISYYLVTETYQQESTVSRYSNTQLGEAIRFTQIYNLPHAGRWQIRLRRTNNASTDIANPDTLHITAIKGQLLNVNKPPNVTLLVMTLKATDVLNTSSALKINTVIQRSLPIYQNNAWTQPQPTNSIAWAIADILRNTIYGGGLNDSDFNLEQLVQLETVWNTQQDEFNGVFDTTQTIWKALQDVAKCGRATPIYQSGKIHIVRDEPQLTATQMFTDRNIIKDSFSLQYIMAGDKPAGFIEVEYFDGTIWKQKTVTTNLNNTTGKPTKIRILGITSPAQAQRECDYIAKANTYRRTNIVFTTELEGLNIQFGDLIKISHEMSGWGIARGSIVGYNAATRTLTLEKAIDIETAQDYVIALRNIDGTPKGSYPIESINNTEIVLINELDYTPSFTSGEYPHYVIGTSDNYAVNALVRKIIPQGQYVKIEAVIDDDRVHA